MSISLAQFRGEFTDALAAVFIERAIPPTTFLRSLFPNKDFGTKFISIDVQRSAGELVALDIVRGADGNRNTFSLSDQKKFLPPYFYEYFDATELDLYDTMLGAYFTGNPSVTMFGDFVNMVADHLIALQNKIERRKELQCAQVLMTGIVTLVNGDNIDFKRKATSMVDLNAGSGGGYWSVGATDPFAQLETGCEFLKTIGMRGDTEFDLIMGKKAKAALFTNATFQARQDQYSMKLDSIMPPTRSTSGAAAHGRVSAGDYNVNLWTYPSHYKDPVTGVVTPYIDRKSVV